MKTERREFEGSGEVKPAATTFCGIRDRRLHGGLERFMARFHGLEIEHGGLEPISPAVVAPASWSAPALWRSGRADTPIQSGRGLPQSKTSRPIGRVREKASVHQMFLAAIILGLLFAGCAVGPDYHRPAALGANPVPAAFGDPAITNAGDWKTAEPSAHLPRGAWWELYDDPELNRLETLAAANNQQIAVALANFEQARASVSVARADFFPQISTSPSATRQRTSANASPTSAATGNSTTFNLFNVSANASWELDLWGRIRRAVEGARGTFTASADDLESAKLSVQAQVASDYFTLRALDAQSDLLTQTAVAYQRALELTQNRHKAGIASDLDVAQAETQLKSAQAQIPAVDLQRAQMRHALAVLCGQPATTFALTPNTVASTNLPAIPVAVPSEWLESRPDISAAERRMAAANANLGVAKAAFYPKVLLNGSGGFQSLSASTLFDWPSRLWAIGPSVQVPIFTGGRNRAQLASARAAYDGTVATYRQTVLTAFQDVEDQLAAQRLLAQQLEGENAALASAQRTLDISNNRYKGGVEAYLDVITAQTTALAHQQSVIQLNGQRLAASVSLIKALGAGWSADKEQVATSDQGAAPPAGAAEKASR
jgi:multidrug efflux system outer membrane protein